MNEMPPEMMQQQYEQPMDSYGGPRMPMQMDQQTEGALMYQLDVVEFHANMEHLLKGEVLEDGKYVVKPELVMMNNIGVGKVMSEIKFRIDRNTILSNLEDEIITRKLRILHENLANILALSYEEWGMGTVNIKSTLRLTLYKIMESVENTLYRAKDKTTLNYFKPQLRIAETQSMMPQRKKLFGMF